MLLGAIDSVRPGRLQHLQSVSSKRRGAGRCTAVVGGENRPPQKGGKNKEREGMGWGRGNKRAKLNTGKRDWKVLLQRDTAEGKRERERRE